MLVPMIHRSLAKSTRFLEVHWSQWISGTFAVVASFALFVYPNVRASLGGGAPVPVVLQFRDKSPLDPTQTKLFGWALDESDAGFYLLKNAQDKDAIFVPRTDVTLVFYGDAGRIQKLTKP